MDCRNPLALLLGLLVGVGGCTTLPGLRKKEAAEPKEEGESVVHKASTYVVFGDFREKASLAKECTEAQRQQLREEARLSYLRALEVEPKYLPAYTALAHLQQANGDHAGAAAVYQKALELNPRDASLWFELGMCQCRLRDWPTALGNLRKAVQLEPSNRQYATVTGYTMARAGQWDEAFEVLKGVNGEARAHYDIARMLRQMNQMDQARAQARAALAADPKLREARTLLEQLDGKVPTPTIQAAAHTVVRPDSTPSAPAATTPAGPARDLSTEPMPKIITPDIPRATVGKPIPLPPLPVIDLRSAGE
jgi:tetratricopeptide (TPR) repeat protein